jgi:hypothetical protein
MYGLIAHPSPEGHEVSALADIIIPQHHNIGRRKPQLGGEQVVQAVHVIAWAPQLRTRALIGAAAAAGDSKVNVCMAAEQQGGMLWGVQARTCSVVRVEG